MQKSLKHAPLLFSGTRPTISFLPLVSLISLLSLSELSPAQAQAPNVSYSGPLVITQGGTYSGNYRSTDSDVPVISIQTTQPVIIENCILAGAGNIVDARGGGTSVTVRNNRGYGLTPSQDNRGRGQFLAMNSPRSLTIEHNYFEQTTGIALNGWAGDGSPSQTLTVRYNQVKNIDSRYRNGGNTLANFIGMDKVLNLANLEIAWNQVINEPNNSLVEDNIAIYNTGGTSQSPMRIHDNYVQGAYPFPATSSNFTGTGMIIDGDQSNTQGFIESYNNQFVSTCNSSMNIAGGHDIYYHDNRLVTSGLLPDGSRLNATYTGVAVFNYYGQGAFSNFRVDNNTIGYVQWGRSNPFTDRQDEGDYGLQIVTNTKHLPNPVTLQTERDEFTLFQQKLSQNGITLGAGGTGGGGTTTPPAPTTPSAPTVSLSAPSTATVGAALNLTASAAAANGTISKVEFFNGATKLGEDLTAPYAFSYTPTAAGTLSLTARATNNAGTATSTAVSSVTVTTTTTTAPPTTGTGTGTTPANSTFFRAINVAGSATTVDGRSWEDGTSAANFQVNGSEFSAQAATLSPATDAARATMIRSSSYSTALSAAVSGVASGTYSVYAYVWEDNDAESFSLTLEGQTVQANYNSGAAGHWDRLGPFTAAITDGTINLGTTGGTANLSGIEIWKQNTGTTVPTTPTTPSAPTVSLSAPSTGTVGAALNLTASAAAANGTITKVEFFNGVTKLGEDLTAPYTFGYTPTAAGTLSLTARATNNAAAVTTSAVASVTIAAATTTTPPTSTVPTFVRAVNLGGGAITLDGKSWAASASATNFSATGVTTFANQGVTLTPTTDATRASMIRSSMYGSSTSLALKGVASGTYSVYLYVWEDNNAESFNISLEGKTVLSGYNSGATGHWDRLGPFTAAVTDGTVNIATTGGTANISGIELWKQATPLP